MASSGQSSWGPSSCTQARGTPHRALLCNASFTQPGLVRWKPGQFFGRKTGRKTDVTAAGGGGRGHFGPPARDHLLHTARSQGPGGSRQVHAYALCYCADAACAHTRGGCLGRPAPAWLCRVRRGPAGGEGEGEGEGEGAIGLQPARQELLPERKTCMAPVRTSRRGPSSLPFRPPWPPAVQPPCPPRSQHGKTVGGKGGIARSMQRPQPTLQAPGADNSQALGG